MSPEEVSTFIVGMVIVLVTIYASVVRVSGLIESYFARRHTQEMQRLQLRQQALMLKEKMFDHNNWLDERRYEVWKTGTLAQISSHGREAAQFVREATKPKGAVIPMGPRKLVDDDPEDPPQTH